MEHKKKRLIFRTSLIVIVVLAVAYAIFQSFNDKHTELVGKEAPNFKLQTLDGKGIGINENRGKVVLINFWGTWCEPCKREMPLLQSMYEKYNKNGFEVLSINMQESTLAVSNFKDKYSLSFPVLLDKQKTVSQNYNVNKLPASFIVDKNGVIKEIFEGELSKQQLEKWILEGLKQ